MTANAPVPFNDLSRTPRAVMDEIERAIAGVLASGWFVMGPNHSALEVELAEYLGVGDAVLVGNGTDALELALAAVGVGPGDLVVTVVNAGAYASTAVRLLGAVPVYADVSPDSLLLTADTFESSLADLPRAPKAVVVTHLYGALAPVAAIAAVAARHGIAVVEDCAQSLGARSGDQLGGTFGDIATTSFYPTKNLGALGDGGAVFTNRPELAEAVRRMRQYGWSSKYAITHAHGRNSRMDELQAAVVRVKLPHLDEWNDRRRAIHDVYASATPSTLRFVNTSSPAFIGHLAVLDAVDRENARAVLGASGIGTEIHYPIPDHRQAFPDFVPLPARLPVSEKAAQTVFSVPLFPELRDDEIARVRDALASL